MNKAIAFSALATVTGAAAIFAAVATGAASKAFDLLTTSNHSCTTQFGKADTRMTWNATSLTMADAKGEPVYEGVSVMNFGQFRTMAERFCADGTLPKLRKETAAQKYPGLNTYACTTRNDRKAEAQEYTNGVRLELSSGDTNFGQLNFTQARKNAQTFCNG